MDTQARAHRSAARRYYTVARGCVRPLRGRALLAIAGGSKRRAQAIARRRQRAGGGGAHCRCGRRFSLSKNTTLVTTQRFRQRRHAALLPFPARCRLLHFISLFHVCRKRTGSLHRWGKQTPPSRVECIVRCRKMLSEDVASGFLRRSAREQRHCSRSPIERLIGARWPENSGCAAKVPRAAGCGTVRS